MCSIILRVISNFYSMDIFKSRTFWMAVAMFILGGIQAIADVMPAEIFVLTQAVLAALVGYFRANPKVQF